MEQGLSYVISLNAYKFHITLFDLAFLGTILIGLTFVVLLWFTPKAGRPANRFLALALAVAVLWMVRLLTIDTGFSAYAAACNRLALQFSLAFGPLIFFYVLKLTRPGSKFRRKDMLHLTPLLVGYGMPAWLVLISVIIYLYLSYRLIQDFYSRLRPVLMDRPRFAFRRLERALFLLGLLCVSALFNAIFFLTVAFVLIGMAAEVILKLDSSGQLAMPVTDRSDAKEKSRRLKEAVAANRFYEDAGLTLTTLAVKLMIHPHELSRIINVGLEKNFSDFINEFRVREVARKMRDPANHRLTLLGIAYESGFNSQRTFNRVFKEMIGKTPAEYKNSLQKELPIDKLATQSRIRPVILRSESPPNRAAEKLNRNYMFRNYLKIACRNILRKKSTSLINISGLSVGMAVALLIGLWINDELSFNHYNENYDHVARVLQSKTIGGTVGTNENIPIPLAAELRTAYGGNFKHVVLASGVWKHILNSGDKQLLKTGSFMQAEAPDLLSLHMIRGTRSGLNDPSSVFLAQATAKALFGNDDPTGKLLKLDNKMSVKISGVYADLPENSSFSDLAFIAPWQLYYTADENLRKADADWGNNSYLLYVQLNDRADVNTVSARIKDAKLRRVDQGSAKFKPAILLQPMSRWHLYAEYKDGVNTGGEITYVWLFGLIGVFVLLLACINFMNLSTARSEKRAREVGVRKAIGSLRSQLITQFFTESIAVALLSFLFAVVLAWLALPLFNQVAGKQISMPWGNAFFWLLCLSFSCFVGLLAGTYPALYLSSFNPVSVLKGTFKAGRFSALPRQVLVVVQFAVSIILIIGTVITFKQIQYSQNRAVGYNRNGLVTTELNSGTVHKQFAAFRNDLISSGAVVDASESGSSTTGIFGGAGGLKWAGKDPQMNDEFAMIGIGTSYGKTVGWQLTRGRDLSSAFSADSNSVVLNEAAVTYMGLKHPVGETIDWWGKKYQVAGVVRNMIMTSPYEPAKPTIFFMDSKPGNFLIIRINPQLSANAAISKIQTIWKQYAPAEPLDLRFVDQEYQKKFANEQKIGTLAGIFSALAIFISCMGIFGMAIFVAEQRIKEIGVRKILGASVFNLWRMLSMDFVVLVGISLVIATPAAWFLMHSWLGHYAYHTELSWWIFALTGIGAIAITLLTVSYQSLKAALMNPVKSLRIE